VGVGEGVNFGEGCRLGYVGLGNVGFNGSEGYGNHQFCRSTHQKCF
jgi:hypothetical protein